MENPQDQKTVEALKDIVIPSKYVDSLMAYISELPTKYGLPLINFLDSITKNSQQDSAERNEVI